MGTAQAPQRGGSPRGGPALARRRHAIAGCAAGEGHSTTHSGRFVGSNDNAHEEEEYWALIIEHGARRTGNGELITENGERRTENG